MPYVGPQRPEPANARRIVSKRPSVKPKPGQCMTISMRSGKLNAPLYRREGKIESLRRECLGRRSGLTYLATIQCLGQRPRPRLHPPVLHHARRATAASPQNIRRPHYRLRLPLPPRPTASERAQRSPSSPQKRHQRRLGGLRAALPGSSALLLRPRYASSSSPPPQAPVPDLHADTPPPRPSVDFTTPPNDDPAVRDPPVSALRRPPTAKRRGSVGGGGGSTPPTVAPSASMHAERDYGGDRRTPPVMMSSRSADRRTPGPPPERRRPPPSAYYVPQGYY